MKASFIVTAVLFSTAVNAQFWKAVGKGAIAPYNVQGLFTDSIEDRLLASGSFEFIMNDEDTVEAHGQAVWNGTRWDSLAHRITTDAGQTYWFLRYQGALYSCGANGFFTPEGDVNYSFARLNEQTEYWEALECLNSPWNGLNQLVPRFANPVLYATGYPGNLCDQETNNVYVYDGSSFIPWVPFDQLDYDIDNYVGSVFDYKGKTYVSGDFRDPLGSGFSTFMRWSGNEWEYVPGWNNSGILKDFLIKDDTLYVTGLFRTSSGAPGNLVASFDGESWNDLGGGLTYYPNYQSAAGYDLGFYHGDLIVSGVFNRAGGAEVDCIAKWNGHQWCGYPGVFEGVSIIRETAVWRDTLYICGGFNTIDGEPIRQAAQWIGGDAVGECSTVGIAEQTGHAGMNGLQVVPLPTEAAWMVRFPDNGPWIVEVYDATGRKVGMLQSSTTSVDLDLRSASSGIYLLRAVAVDGRILSSKVVR